MGGLEEQRYRALQFSGISERSVVLDVLQSGFRDAGATHVLVSGLPLPGRPIAPLVLRVRWNGLQDVAPANLEGLDGADPLLHMALGQQRSVVGTAAEMLGDKVGRSQLVTLSGLSPEARYIVVPICGMSPYQAVVIGAGEEFHADDHCATTLEHFSCAAFRRLLAIQAIEPSRPGGLSLRERHVVELSACGKTAQEIAEILDISQRTVHAHLQNASAKLMAGNKTQTVVEALRYGQIKI